MLTTANLILLVRALQHVFFGVVFECYASVKNCVTPFHCAIESRWETKPCATASAYRLFENIILNCITNVVSLIKTNLLQELGRHIPFLPQSNPSRFVEVISQCRDFNKASTSPMTLDSSRTIKLPPGLTILSISVTTGTRLHLAKPKQETRSRWNLNTLTFPFNHNKIVDCINNYFKIHIYNKF